MSSYDGPYHATGLVVVICVFVPLAIIAVSVRTFTRSRIVRIFAADDLLDYGLGKHLYDVPLDDLYPNFLKINVIAAILFCAATGMAKTSILLFYRRIFPSRKFHCAIWGLVAFTVCYSSASVLANVFSCRPISASWDIKYAGTAECINRPVFYFAQAGLGIATDFATVIAPLPMIVCVVSIIRLKSLYVLLKGSDLTVDTVDALTWCVIELNLSIVGGCAPTLRPFMRKYCPRVLGSSGRMYGSDEARPGKGHSYPLKSHDKSTPATKDSKSRLGIPGGNTVTGENESEEFIIGQKDSLRDDLEFGGIVRTVDFGYEEGVEQRER
ncbi:integral membrane protein [Botrytis cinerea]